MPPLKLMQWPNLGQVVACIGLASNSLNLDKKKGISNKDVLPLVVVLAVIADFSFSQLAPHPSVIHQPVT